jgi:hypothetical protein
MPLKDQIAHAAAVTKWKADQQMRLMRSQSRIGECENQIRTVKATLADKALLLYSQEQLVEEDLKQICANISELHRQIKEQQSLQDAIRSERPPEQTIYSSVVPTAPPAETFSGLVCPQCNRPLVGRFCPDHGVEGVPSKPDPEPIEVINVSPQLVCPVCGKVLSVRFCPEDGVEGIPQSN